MSQGKEGIPEYALDLMTDTLKQLDGAAQGAFLQKFFQGLVGRRFSEGDSITHWERILSRRSQWAEKLGCPVTLRTAAWVHFEELAILQNPVPAIQTVRNQAGRSAYARSASWSIRSARTALDGLSEGQLSTFRFGSSPACDR